MITVECASIFNTDFTACLYALLDQNDDVLLIIKDNADIDSPYRKFISRLAFPTMDWAYNDDDKWRLIHFPIEKITSENVREVFAEFGQSLTTLLNHGDNRIAVDHIYANLASLAALYETGDSLLFYTNVIRKIFSDISDSSPVVGFSTSLLNETVRLNAKKIFLGEMIALGKTKPGVLLKFVKSGSFKLVTNGQVLKLKYFSVTETVLSFYIKANQAPVRQLNWSLSQEFAELIDHCELDGQFEISALAQLGKLGHLSYFYFPEYTDTAPNKLKEFVSPISVVDLQRVSTFNGGGGHRLWPSGASLLDFDTPELILIIQGICKDKRVKYELLQDWMHLADNFPRSDEKIQEHQGEIKTYCKRRVDAAQLSFRQGRLLKTKTLFLSPIDLSFVEYGRFIVEYHAFFRYLRTLMSLDNPFTLSASEIEFLQSAGLLNKELSIDVIPFLQRVKSLFSLTGTKLVGLGFDEAKWMNLSERFSELSARIEKTRHFPTEKADQQRFKDFNHIGLLAPAFELLLEYYYSFAAFVIASPLKANIFTGYILFGPKRYRELILKNMDKRGKARYLSYQLVNFED